MSRIPADARLSTSTSRAVPASAVETIGRSVGLPVAGRQSGLATRSRAVAGASVGANPIMAA